jgi:hypothetical protein
MKITLKRNIILATLATIFFFVAQNGYTNIMSEKEFLAPFLAIFGSIAFTITTAALLVRLWGNEKE